MNTIFSGAKPVGPNSFDEDFPKEQPSGRSYGKAVAIGGGLIAGGILAHSLIKSKTKGLEENVAHLKAALEREQKLQHAATAASFNAKPKDTPARMIGYKEALKATYTKYKRDPNNPGGFRKFVEAHAPIRDTRMEAGIDKHGKHTGNNAIKNPNQAGTPIYHIIGGDQAYIKPELKAENGTLRPDAKEFLQEHLKKSLEKNKPFAEQARFKTAKEVHDKEIARQQAEAHEIIKNSDKSARGVEQYEDKKTWMYHPRVGRYVPPKDHAKYTAWDKEDVAKKKAVGLSRLVKLIEFEVQVVKRDGGGKFNKPNDPGEEVSPRHMQDAYHRPEMSTGKKVAIGAAALGAGVLLRKPLGQAALAVARQTNYGRALENTFKTTTRSMALNSARNSIAKKVEQGGKFGGERVKKKIEGKLRSELDARLAGEKKSTVKAKIKEAFDKSLPDKLQRAAKSHSDKVLDRFHRREMIQGAIKEAEAKAPEKFKGIGADAERAKVGNKVRAALKPTVEEDALDQVRHANAAKDKARDEAEKARLQTQRVLDETREGTGHVKASREHTKQIAELTKQINEKDKIIASTGKQNLAKIEAEVRAKVHRENVQEAKSKLAEPHQNNHGPVVTEDGKRAFPHQGELFTAVPAARLEADERKKKLTELYDHVVLHHGHDYGIEHGKKPTKVQQYFAEAHAERLLTGMEKRFAGNPKIIEDSIPAMEKEVKKDPSKRHILEAMQKQHTALTEDVEKLKAERKSNTEKNNPPPKPKPKKAPKKKFGSKPKKKGIGKPTDKDNPLPGGHNGDSRDRYNEYNIRPS